MTIAKAIIDAISEDWLTATAYAGIEEDDNGLTSGKYISAAKPDSINYFDPPLEIYLAFDELRRRMRRPDAAPWVKACFSSSQMGILTRISLTQTQHKSQSGWPQPIKYLPASKECEKRRLCNFSRLGRLISSNAGYQLSHLA